MSVITRKFFEAKTKPSDINEHLDTLLKYAKECEHLTEMGVRWVVSTWAFLESRPKKLTSYDISYHEKEKIDEVVQAAKDENIDFSFILADVLAEKIEKTDLLFIDTLHTYSQLIQELKKHSVDVKKYIILHDTETFGNVDESVYSHASNLATLESKSVGLKSAIRDFLLDSEDGKNWEAKESFTHNNGLTILRRKNGTYKSL